MLNGLTSRQILFADAYAKCRRGKAAAIEAGYSEKSAASQASRLLKCPEIQAALKRRIDPPAAQDDMDNKTPLQHLLDVMNNPEARVSRRDRAAIAAAPYVHAKAGAKLGMKEQKQLDANKAASGKFRPNVAPVVALVQPVPPGRKG